MIVSFYDVWSRFRLFVVSFILFYNLSRNLFDVPHMSGCLPLFTSSRGFHFCPITLQALLVPLLSL